MRQSLAVGLMDFAVIEGRRSKEKQDEYFNNKKSKVQWPNSKHNVINPTDLANAVDVVPYINGTISWNKIHCVFLAGVILTMAKKLSIKIRWGGNWDMDLEPITDQDFQDLVHYEIIGG
jgi:peptidoglycan L-alanyl-D-glutamate endopeptidase CwlK